jgi:lysozyme
MFSFCLIRSLSIGIILLALPRPAFAETRDLVDDFSRGDLLRYAMTLGPAAAAVPDRFVFPDDAQARTEWSFGTDVSHHDGTIDWSKARQHEVRYVWVKATQGTDFKDRMFAKNWADLEKMWANETTRVHRGAYHFMSAQGDAKAQAQNFLSIVASFLPTDLPATIDLEWDAPAGSADPGRDDRWQKLSADEIIEKALVWLEEVERASGKVPVIYTAASWWSERIGKTDKLNKYKIWIADYTRKSQLNETPRLPAGREAPLWQFSERGRVKDGFSTNVDVNVFKGGVDQFLATLSPPK